MADNHVSEFQMLRVRIEAKFPEPAIIVFGSASHADGTSFCAYGLASAFASAGQRALVVRLVDETDESKFQALEASRLLEVRLEDYCRNQGPSSLKMLSIWNALDRSPSRHIIAGLCTRLRSEYDYVVVDVGQMPGNPLGIVLTDLSDATIVALRAGRVRSPSDNLLVELLKRSSSTFLGIVEIDKKTIGDFRLIEHSPQNVVHRLPVEVRGDAPVGGRAERA